MRDAALHKRVLDLCYRNKTSHVGSCLSAAGIIDDVYSQRQPGELFVLSCGHAGIALYAVLEKYEGQDAQALYEAHGVHPSTDVKHGIVCSSGSLGCGLAIACGIALANPDSMVRCLISDGECAEGIVWEALAFMSTHPLDNLTVIVNSNGFGATREIDYIELTRRLGAFSCNVFCYRTEARIPGVCDGLEAHYHVLTENEYAAALC